MSSHNHQKSSKFNTKTEVSSSIDFGSLFYNFWSPKWLRSNPKIPQQWPPGTHMDSQRPDFGDPKTPWASYEAPRSVFCSPRVSFLMIQSALLDAKWSQSYHFESQRCNCCFQNDSSLMLTAPRKHAYFKVLVTSYPLRSRGVGGGREALTIWCSRGLVWHPLKSFILCPESRSFNENL